MRKRRIKKRRRDGEKKKRQNEKKAMDYLQKISKNKRKNGKE